MDYFLVVQTLINQLKEEIQFGAILPRPVEKFVAPKKKKMAVTIMNFNRRKIITSDL